MYTQYISVKSRILLNNMVFFFFKKKNSQQKMKQDGEFLDLLDVMHINEMINDE